jgi:hypothetical protein
VDEESQPPCVEGERVASRAESREHHALERLAVELRELRPWAKERYPTYAERRDFFQALVAERLA